MQTALPFRASQAYTCPRKFLAGQEKLLHLVAQGVNTTCPRLSQLAADTLLASETAVWDQVLV
jgi:hypothetical protein